MDKARICNLDKDVELPDIDAGTMSVEQRDNIVGAVYARLMEIESRLLPCGLHVIGKPPTAEEAIAVAGKLRQRRIPSDVITLDGRAAWDVQTRFDFQWDAQRYPHPAAALAKMKAQGLRVCVWEYPYVSIHSRLFAELASKRYLLTTERGDPYVFGWDTAPGTSPFGDVLTALPESGIVDFTNPAAYAWWRDAHAALFTAGVDVIKAMFEDEAAADAASDFEAGNGELPENEAAPAAEAAAAARGSGTRHLPRRGPRPRGARDRRWIDRRLARDIARRCAPRRRAAAPRRKRTWSQLARPVRSRRERTGRHWCQRRRARSCTSSRVA